MTEMLFILIPPEIIWFTHTVLWANPIWSSLFGKP